MSDATATPTEHTPEPWFVSESSGTSVTTDPKKSAGYPADSAVIASLSDGEYVENPCAKADARRIVACVNACQGIETETLESGIVFALTHPNLEK